MKMKMAGLSPLRLQQGHFSGFSQAFYGHDRSLKTAPNPMYAKQMFWADINRELINFGRTYIPGRHFLLRMEDLTLSEELSKSILRLVPFPHSSSEIPVFFSRFGLQAAALSVDRKYLSLPAYSYEWLCIVNDVQKFVRICGWPAFQRR